MARSAQRRQRRSPRPRPETAPKRRPTAPARQEEYEMFFPRLRRQAKWMFVFLALIFGVGYVVFNVGGTIPGTGLGDVLQNLGQGTAGPDVDEAREKARENPNDAEAQRELANALVQDGRQAEAIAVLRRYLELRPRDENAIRQLAGFYITRAGAYRSRAEAAQAEALAAAPGTSFAPGTSPFAQELTRGEISKQLSEDASRRLNDAVTKMQEQYKQAQRLYARLATLLPDDQTIQLDLAGAAQGAQDIPAALKAYQRFLKIAPDDPNAPFVRQQIQQLRAAQTIPSG